MRATQAGKHMVSAYAGELRRLYSSDRLARYAMACNDDFAMVIAYHWNVELCEALYPSLAAVELALRNSIHLVLTDQFGRDTWFDTPNLLQRDESRALASIQRKIVNAGKPLTPGRVVAGLNFGFWTGLLSSLYGNSPKGPQLWTPPTGSLLPAVFPHAPANVQPFRGRIHTHFDEVRKLRNRVFHYEAIFDDPLLLQRHDDILDLIGWISPPIRDSTLALDRFPSVVQSGRQSIRRQLEAHLGK